MGYYTQYEICLDGSQSDIQQFAKTHGAFLLNVLEAFDSDPGYYSGEGKWYNWQFDMMALSVLWPNIEFQVNGRGEDNDDVWRARVRNGKLQRVEATLTFPSWKTSCTDWWPD
jgi:hypothetical protein